VTRPNPIVRPENVHLDFGLMGSVAGNAGVTRRAGGGPDVPETFRFDFRGNVAVSLIADVQVGLHAEADRALCDLQLMQFVTPRRYEAVYAGIKGGHTRVQFSAAVENKLFLDGHTSSSSDLSPANFPWMSLVSAARFRPNTRAGHFINQCFDKPGTVEPSWLVVAHDDPFFAGAKHFLWRMERFDEFITLAVFVHPSGERQPLAVARWTCQHSYTFSWHKNRSDPEIANVVSGRSIVAQTQAPSSNPADLLPHVAKVRSPPAWILPIVNPQLTAAFAGSGVSGIMRMSSPLDHPEVPSDFFVVQR